MIRSPAKLLEWRFAPAAILAVAALIVLAGIAVILQNEGEYQQRRGEQTLVQAEVLAASVAAPLDFRDAAAAQEAVDAFRANRQVRRIAVFTADGRFAAGYDKAGRSLPQTFRSMSAAAMGNLQVLAPVISSGQRVGEVVFEVEAEPLSRRVARYLVLVALIALTALVVAVLGVAQAAMRRANGELAKRADALAEANAMLEEQMQERAKAEDQLRQAQKMQALGQLTGGIAHDFNNLLTVIQGAADMLCRDELPEAKRKRFAQAIVQASTSAAALTSQLLAFARRQPLRPERLIVSALIRDMIDLVQGTIGQKARLETDLRSNCAVEVDRAQLQSAILNIASNARDAMPTGGMLAIATREFTSDDGQPMIALEMRDTGGGMDADTLERIFEPFFTTKGTGKGTGLGLSQVYGFTSQSGGEVQVVSTPGRGTTLTLSLPCVDGEPPERVAGEVEALPQRPSSVLVVEDNEEVGQFAETLLSELGHEVTRAGTGEEALELCRARAFDIVFSDVVMPGMGGLKLAEALAREQPDLPVVLATGYSHDISVSGSGGRPVILKPYRLSTLSQALGEALAGRGRG